MIDGMIAYVDGHFLPAEKAAVSVFDRGLRWGDGIYDVERTFRHEIFRMEDHVQRMERACRHARITPGLGNDEMQAIALEMVARNAACIPADSDLEVCQIVTRGTLLDSDHATIIMYCRELDWKRLARLYRHGAPLVISSVRNIPPQCLPPTSKIANKMNQKLAELEVKAVNSDSEGLMLDVHGNVAEGTSTNFFFAADGVLHTPSLHNCLPGVSRMTVIELARRLGIPVQEGTYSPFDLSNADEAFLTSSTPCLFANTSINGLPFRLPAPGPVFTRLVAAWKELVGMDFVEQALGKA